MLVTPFPQEWMFLPLFRNIPPYFTWNLLSTDNSAARAAALTIQNMVTCFGKERIGRITPVTDNHIVGSTRSRETVEIVSFTICVHGLEGNRKDDFVTNGAWLLTHRLTTGWLANGNNVNKRF